MWKKLLPAFLRRPTQPSRPRTSRAVCSLLRNAVRLQQDGRLDEAQSIYQQALALHPDHPDALHLLGVIAHAHEDSENAALLIGRALALIPWSAVAHFNMGNVLCTLERPALALVHYDRSIELQPAAAATWCNRGNALIGLDLHEEALASFDRALIIAPAMAAAAECRAIALHQMGRLDEALAAHDHALRLQPDVAGTFQSRDYTLAKLNLVDEALASYEQKLLQTPEADGALVCKGDMLQALGRSEQALAAYDQVLMRQTKLSGAALNNKGNVLQALGRYDEALLCYEQSLHATSKNTMHFVQAGCTLDALRRCEARLSDYGKALAQLTSAMAPAGARDRVVTCCTEVEKAFRQLSRVCTGDPNATMLHLGDPVRLDAVGRNAYPSFQDSPEFMPPVAPCAGGDAEQAQIRRQRLVMANYSDAIRLPSGAALAHLNRAHCRLAMGDFQGGWQEYEWRWNATLKNFYRHFVQPLWLGDQSLHGKTILLHAEQGLGDTIQFCRYVPMVAALGATVLLEVPESLVGLLKSLDGVASIMPTGQTPRAFDYHCPLMSLPLAFRSSATTIPTSPAYLHPANDRVAWWNAHLGAHERLRVGLAWSGNNLYKNDHLRSLPLAEMTALMNPGLEFIRLQKELREHDQPALESNPHLRCFAEKQTDFGETAALIATLDLVISVDTSVAHLAGAMGKPVWVLLPKYPCWRWGLREHDTPWYPSMKLFRQEQWNDWKTLIGKVAAELETVSAERKNTAETFQ